MVQWWWHCIWSSLLSSLIMTAELVLQKVNFAANHSIEWWELAFRRIQNYIGSNRMQKFGRVESMPGAGVYSMLVSTNTDCLFQMIQWFKSNDSNPMIQTTTSQFFGPTNEDSNHNKPIFGPTNEDPALKLLLLLLAALSCFQAVFW